jgi:hypothetical protein
MRKLIIYLLVVDYIRVTKHAPASVQVFQLFHIKSSSLLGIIKKAKPFDEQGIR